MSLTARDELLAAALRLDVDDGALAAALRRRARGGGRGVRAVGERARGAALRACGA